MTGATADSPTPHGGQSNLRRRVALAVVTLVIPAALIVWLSLGRDQDGPNSSGISGGSATESSPSSEAPGPLATPTEVVQPPLDATSAIPALQPVPLDAAVDYGNGVSVFIADVTRFEAQAQGAGERSGPALRVRIVITNLTGQELGLDTVTVNLASGPDRSPAAPVSDDAARPFSGTLASGDSAEGRYSFSVAEDALDSITVTLNYTAGAVTAVFTGAVS